MRVYAIFWQRYDIGFGGGIKIIELIFCVLKGI
jgi:hypothetical protein